MVRVEEENSVLSKNSLIPIHLLILDHKERKARISQAEKKHELIEP
jgi:hypothetical protein